MNDKPSDGPSKGLKVRVLLSTCPVDRAQEIAQFLVERGHAACVNIVPQVASVYRWEGRVEKEAESLLVIKCPKDKAKETMKALVDRHPYDVPEVLTLNVKGGNKKYVKWVHAAVEE